MDSTALTPAQRAYRDKKEHMEKYAADVNKAALKAAEKLQKENPAYKGLKIIPLNRAYIQGEGNTGKAMLDILDKIMTDTAGRKTQAEIVKEVAPNHPKLNLYPSIFQRPLQPYALKKMQLRISCSANPIKINGCKTLSDIQKLLQAKKQEEAAVRSYKRTISFSKEAVTVDGKIYTVQKRGKTKSIRVLVRDKYQWIRMDALLLLMVNE